MVAQGGGGTIINMASVNALLAIPNQVPYGASKGAINQLTRVMAVGLAPHRIRVNCVCPGHVETALTASVMADPAWRARMITRYPLGRFGHVDDVAAAILYLASDEASFVSGQVIYVAGGPRG